MLLFDFPLIASIRQGVDSEVFVYREGDQLWGKGDTRRAGQGQRERLRPHDRRRPPQGALAAARGADRRPRRLSGGRRAGRDGDPDGDGHRRRAALHLPVGRAEALPGAVVPGGADGQGRPGRDGDLPGRGARRPRDEGRRDGRGPGRRLGPAADARHDRRRAASADPASSSAIRADRQGAARPGARRALREGEEGEGAGDRPPGGPLLRRRGGPAGPRGPVDDGQGGRDHLSAGGRTGAGGGRAVPGRIRREAGEGGLHQRVPGAAAPGVGRS